MEKNTLELEITPFQLVILLLSVYTLAILGVEATVDLSAETLFLLCWVDFAIAWLFLFDIGLRWRQRNFAPGFWKWGWIDLLASIPVWPDLRWLRVVRIIRIVRLLRTIRGSRYLLAVLLRHRFKNALVGVALLTFVVVTVASISILAIERDAPEANIRSLEDALWWSWVTVTTVGYGDCYPVTTAGRILAGVVMLWGVGLFSVFTAALATVFIEKPEDRWESLEAKMDRLLSRFRDE